MKARILLVIVIFLLFGGCTSEDSYTPNDPPQVIADIAYDVNESHGYTVYIKENDEYVPYLVLTNDYGGNCLLLRKFLIDEPMRYNITDETDTPIYIDKPSYYENCIIDKYLNSQFVNSLSTDFSTMIIDTNLQITDEDSIGRCGDNTTQIMRKVFLLSLNEVQEYTASVMLREGEELSYFTNNDRRIATTLEGIPQNWYLRTPDTWDRDVITYVDINGSYDMTGLLTIAGHTEYYIRPAFCLPQNTKLGQKTIGYNEVIYTVE